MGVGREGVCKAGAWDFWTEHLFGSRMGDEMCVAKISSRVTWFMALVSRANYLIFSEFGKAAQC